MTLTLYNAALALVLHYGDRPDRGPVLEKLIVELRTAVEMATPMPRSREENPYCHGNPRDDDP